jgi:outer membrane protein assembly factor BamA
VPFGSNEEEKLVIQIPVEEGPRFTLASVRIEGDAKSAADEVITITRAIQAPRDYDRGLLDETRRKLVSALGRRGYALAQVRLDINPSEVPNAMDAVYTIDPGEPVEVGIIRFEGNSHLPDKFLRKELVTREAEVFDSSSLDKSIERLNRSSLVQEVRREDVSLSLDPERNALDITFKLKEKDRQGIFATGGTGGAAGGYLGVIYTAFNLLGLGDALTLELDGGAAQSNVLVNLVVSRFLGSPFALALSGFHRYTNLNVASLVPGPDDLLSVFRRRSSGIGLSGAYTVTANSQLGLGYQVEHESFSGVEEVGTHSSGAGEKIRGELTPVFVFDSTKDSGPAARGTRLIMSNALIGSPLLGSIHAVRPSLFYSRYLNDPWTAGRNAFAFRLQGGTLRALGRNSLPLDMRYFPGDEVVRGFRRGSLSPWVHDPEGPESLRPVGADTVLGISAEYRIPMRGALSSAVFADLGWARLGDLGKIDNLNNETRLIEDTDRLLRASAGGELRLQLPVIRQPARLIFAWNPLRLDRVVQGVASPTRLVDPRGAVRFALGNIF